MLISMPHLSTILKRHRVSLLIFISTVNYASFRLNFCKISHTLSTFQFNLVQIANNTPKARSFRTNNLNCEASESSAYTKNTLIDRVKNSFSLLNCTLILLESGNLTLTLNM